jgi:hypothetical protein
MLYSEFFKIKCFVHQWADIYAAQTKGKNTVPNAPTEQKGRCTYSYHQNNRHGS